MARSPGRSSSNSNLRKLLENLEFNNSALVTRHQKQEIENLEFVDGRTYEFHEDPSGLYLVSLKPFNSL